MKCPKCRFQNPESMTFCGECGAKLEKICSKCSFPNPPQFKFCGQCGHDLNFTLEPSPRELSFDEKLHKIQSYLPTGLTEKILSQRGKIEGEHKQVTVMFCDMQGFTPLSEKLGPEKVYAMMDEVYEILIHKVHDYEGTVNEMTGDGIMALFGAPIALEDASQRAIRSAMAIHREMTRFNERSRQEKGEFPPIKMRIGIHTGHVVVGTLGNDLRVEFKAVGDTVNLAARMEQLAEPGTTYVTEETFRLTEGFFRFESLGQKTVKGKEKPLLVYRVIAPTSRRTRFEVSAEKGLSPFVGRERDLGLLLERFERSKEGRGQAVSIISEAGTGKSRLLYEFRKAVVNEEVTFLEGRCLSYSRHVPYHPLVEVLKASFYIQDNDADQEIIDKVTKGIQLLNLDEPSTLPYLLDILSVEDNGIDKIPMSPEARKDRTLEALKRVVLKGSALRPLIMAIEDLHWIDRSSEDALKSIMDSIAGSRVFLIYTYRPEFTHAWGNRSYHTQITLNRLSDRESLVIVNHLLNTQMIERDLEDLILTKSEGSPFFTEEIVNSFTDLKIIEKTNGSYKIANNLGSISIPSTIQDMIMARVDHLPERAREILRIGSAIEREFDHRLIEKTAELPEPELLSHLSILKDAELLYERGLHPQSTYIFKHSLTREVVYGSILEQKKRKLHERIGIALEELYKERMDEHCETIAGHFLAAGIDRKAAEYSKLASLKSEKSGALKTCIEHAKRRVDALERLSRDEHLENELIGARVAMALYLFQMGYFKQAKETVEIIQDRVVKEGSTSNLAMIYVFMGTYNYMVEENYSESLTYLEEAVRISEKVADFVSFGFANYMLGLVLSFNCEFARATAHFQKLLDMSMAIRSAWRASAMKSNLSVYAYNYNGQVGLGFRTSQEALRMAEESGDILSMAMAYTAHGTSCYYRGFLKEAEGYLRKGILYSEKIDLMTHSALAHQWLGHTYFDLGGYSMAKDHYRETIRLREQSGLFPSSANLNRIALARASVLNNEKDIDLKTVYGCVKENRLKLYEGWVARFMSEILMHMGESYYSRAAEWIERAIEADRRNHMTWDLGRDYALLGELLRLQGKQAEAGQELNKAIKTLEECGADAWSELMKLRFSAFDKGAS